MADVSIETREAVERALLSLTKWSASLTWDEVPEDVKRRAALILLDDFGALVAARSEPELIAFRKQIAAYSGKPEATVFDGGACRLDRYSAALSNGTAADWCELDGGYRPVVCHAALYCISALLAEAEARDSPLRDLLLALIVGYETVARIARCFTFPGLVLHPHGGLATVGAAAAVAKLRGIDAESAAAAITTGATLVLPGPFGHAVEGALIRNVWPGLCAQNGIRAVDWVEIGIQGGPYSLTDVFAAIMGAESAPEELCRALGQHWAIRDAYHKMHACCQYGHSTVEAVLAALQGVGTITPDMIERISVETHWKARKLDNPRPATTLAAKFSIQHIAAATLVYGHAGAAAFHADTLTRPDLDRLRHRVEIAPFEPELEWPNDRPSRVRITLTDGRVLSGECLSAPGGADRPFTEDEIATKVRANVLDAYPGAAEVISRTLALEPALLRIGWAKIAASIVGCDTSS
jgi:2-methylcitrate dehydratase PrpD